MFVTQARHIAEMNEARLNRHEDECGKRYAKISDTLEKLNDNANANAASVSAKLAEHNSVVAAQLADTNEKREAQMAAIRRLIWKVLWTAFCGLAFVVYSQIKSKLGLP